MSANPVTDKKIELVLILAILLVVIFSVRAFLKSREAEEKQQEEDVKKDTVSKLGPTGEALKKEIAEGRPPSLSTEMAKIYASRFLNALRGTTAWSKENSDKVDVMEFVKTAAQMTNEADILKVKTAFNQRYFGDQLLTLTEAAQQFIPRGFLDTINKGYARRKMKFRF